MKTRFFRFSVFLFFISFCFLLHSQDADFLFESGKFQEASKLYESTGQKDAKANFRLGCCFLKQGKKGLALLYFRRAQKLASAASKKIINEFINFIKKDASYDDSPHLHSFSVYGFINPILKSVPTIVLQLIFLILWFFLLYYLSIFFRRKRLKTIVCMLFLILSFFGILLIKKYRIANSKLGVVISSNTKILSGPGVNFYVLYVLPETSEVKILSEFGEHFKIRTRNLAGWVEKSDIGVI